MDYLIATGSVATILSFVGWLFSRLFKNLSKKFEKIDKQFEKIDKQFEKIDGRFEKIDEKFEKIDGKFERLEKKMDEGFNELRTEIREVNKRVDQLVFMFSRYNEDHKEN